jgi:hypothetical protein
MKTLIDIRETPEFEAFKSQVLEFVREEKCVTWRNLSERFPGEHYRIALAVEGLDESDDLIYEKEKFPETIRVKGDINMPKSKIDAAGLEKCAANGLNKTQAAAEIGVAVNTLITAISQKPEYREAWNRGLMRRTGGTCRPSAPKPEVPPSPEPYPPAAVPEIKPEIEPETAIAKTEPIAQALAESGGGKDSVEVLESSVLVDVKDLLKKVRAEFIYQEAWNEPSPRRGDLLKLIEGSI